MSLLPERRAAVARQHGQHEREPVAVDAVGHPPRRDELARRHERLNLDEQRARALHRAQHHRARGAGGLGDEARARVLDLDEAVLVHLEDADLAGRAEAVLERAQRAIGPLALALEGQDAVDQVLEHPRSRDRALLGHVPDQDHGHAALLREPHQATRHLAHLPDRAGAAGHRRVVEHLHRVDDADLRPLGLDRREHRVEVRLGDDRHAERGRAEALRAQLDLGRRLLPRHVQDTAAGRGQVAERGARERRLADAGRAADQDERARHDAAAEHAVELADAGAAGARSGPPRRRRAPPA